MDRAFALEYTQQLWDDISEAQSRKGPVGSDRRMIGHKCALCGLILMSNADGGGDVITLV